MLKYLVVPVQAVVLLLLFVPAFVSSTTLNIENSWPGIFSGRTASIEVTLLDDKGANIFLNWKLVLKGRTLSSGQQAIRVNKNSESSVNLVIKTPLLKPRVVLEAQLVIETAYEGDPKLNKTDLFPINLYGPDLLLEDELLHKKLDIKLFDPVGKLSNALDRINIPYKLRSKSQIMGLNEKGLVVIGSGIALDRQRGLFNRLVELAKLGRNVLIVQPASGVISISELSIDRNVGPSSLSFSDDSYIEVFAKGYKWIKNDPLRSQGVKLHSHRNNLVMKVVEHKESEWVWFQARLAKHKGLLIVSTLPFTSYLEDSPTAQLIFSQLLVYANK